MPITVLANEAKNRWLNLRVEASRKAAFEQAAAVYGQTVSQWSLANLDAAAGRDIAASRTLCLTDEAFAQVCDMLDEPIPEEQQELANGRPAWV
ncbi:MAG: DUF1778 domain-containing protein [Eggerthellaceae bacterium]|nr:DUF1778 domain-containing protein [Eggerthellaceae bacterium]